MPKNVLEDFSRYKPPEYAEYQPPPTLGDYQGSTIGWGLKRAFGGPLMRLLEAPQQYIYAGAANSQRRLPEEWRWHSPLTRIIYPGRTPRVTEAAITNTEDMTTNLALALTLDPLNAVGGLGAVTRLGRVSKAVRGLAATQQAVRRFGKGEQAIDKTIKFLKGSRNTTQLTRRIELLGGKSEAFKPVIKGFEQFGADIFEETGRLSTAIRTGRAAGFGVGPTAGIGGTSYDIAAPFRKPIADVVERVEDVYQGTKTRLGLQKLGPKQLMLRRTGLGAELIEHPEHTRYIDRLKTVFKQDSVGTAIDAGRDVRKVWLDEFTLNGYTGRDLHDALENGTSDQLLEMFAENYERLRMNWFDAESKLRDVPYLDNYFTRTLHKNNKGVSMANALYESMLDDAGQALKKLGMSQYAAFKWRRAMGGSPFISVTNLSHYARSEIAPKKIQEMRNWLLQQAQKAELRGNVDVATELRNVARPMEDIINDYDAAGTFLREISPFQYNDEWHRRFPNQIRKFLDSPRAREFGLSADSAIEDFRYFEEDMGKIIDVRNKRFAESTQSGNILGRYFGEFGFKEGTPEFQTAAQLASQSGLKLHRVKDVLPNLLDRNRINIESIVGKIGEDIFMDDSSLAGAAQLLNAWYKIPETHQLIKTWDGLNNIWARMTLFGGRSSYVFNNLTGDRFRMFLHGVSPKHMSGAPALQLQLAEDRVLKNLPHIKGVSDDTVLAISRTTGRKYTKRQILDMITQYDVDGGLFESEVFQAIDTSRWAQSNEINSMKDIVKNMTKGEIVPGFKNIVSFFERNGRYSTFMDFLEKGFHPADAAAMVEKIAFNYSKQNKWMRRFLPFHYWTWKNTPDIFREMFKQPGKMRAVHKLQASAFDGDDPTEDATPEYLQATGVYYVTDPDTGKDIYIDLNNIPAYSAMEITGLLDNGGIGAAVQEVARLGWSMTSPAVQLPVELAFNRDLFMGRSIIGGGAGVIPETGMKEFFGYNIEGHPEMQIIAHSLESVITPTQLGQQVKKAIEGKYPHKQAWVKFFTGVPFRFSDRDSAEWINLQKERNKHVSLANHYEKINNRYMQRKHEREAKKFQNRINRLSKRLERKKTT